MGKFAVKAAPMGPAGPTWGVQAIHKLSMQSASASKNILNRILILFTTPADTSRR
jgi:hypothetical protein